MRKPSIIERLLKRISTEWWKWYVLRKLKKLPFSERGYVGYPTMQERTDGRMVTYLNNFIRCEAPAGDGSDDFCVNALPPNEICSNHSCLANNRRGGMYRATWTDEDIWKGFEING